MKYSEEFTNKDRCVGCPQLIKIAETYDDTDEHIQTIVDAGLGGTFEETLKRFLDSQGVSSDDIEAYAAESSPQIRERISEYIDRLEGEQKVKAMQAKAMQDSCEDGVLKMRAARNGKRVVASVCMSAMMPEMTKDSAWEAVTIVRSNVPKDDNKS